MTGRQVEVAGDADLRHLIAQFAERPPDAYTVGQNLYALCRLCACPLRLYDSHSQETIRRYVYAQVFQVPPFAGDYDRLPAWWLDAAQIIATELAACGGCECVLCSRRSGLRHGSEVYRNQ
ncbi:MAG: hypothetical protein V3U35_03485 [Candidatus Neomarinimicrobiota bacterium]